MKDNFEETIDYIVSVLKEAGYDPYKQLYAYASEKYFRFYNIYHWGMQALFEIFRIFCRCDAELAAECGDEMRIIGKSAPRNGVLHCCAGLQHLSRCGHPPRLDIACGGGSEAAAEAAA